MSSSQQLQPRQPIRFVFDTQEPEQQDLIPINAIRRLTGGDPMILVNGKLVSTKPAE